MLRWILVVLGALIGLVLLIVLVSALLPKEHRATASITLRQPPDSVWGVIRDLAGYPDWSADLQSTERVADPGGREVWRQRDRRGQELPVEVVESESPHRLVTRITDASLPFSGTWTIQVQEAPGGSRVTLTEAGEIRSPLFRFMARFVFGYYGTIESFLGALSRRFGEQATVYRPSSS